MTRELCIYMDNMATTPVDPRVLDAMLPFYREQFGNAASDHPAGRAARQAVEEARSQIAALVGASPGEIIFTSGATESDNLALKGVVEAIGVPGCHIITAATEHKAILDSARSLKDRGVRVSILPVDPDGMVDPDELRRAFTERTVLVSVMLANNEIGVLQPVAELARIAHEHGALFHTDAAQAAGKVPIDVGAVGVDLMSLTAHKLYGPKGIGALYVRREAQSRLSAQVHGGGHESNLRSGTLNVAGIVAFGKACALAADLLPDESERLIGLRNRLLAGLQEDLTRVHINGHPTRRLSGNLNLCFDGVDGDAVLAGLEDIELSAGAACNSGSVTPSYVLKALGLSDRQARSSLRFGLGRFNTAEEVDYVASRLTAEVRRLRELSPVWEE